MENKLEGENTPGLGYPELSTRSNDLPQRDQKGDDNKRCELDCDESNSSGNCVIKDNLGNKRVNSKGEGLEANCQKCRGDDSYKCREDSLQRFI